MKNILTGMAGVTIALALAACTPEATPEPETGTTADDVQKVVDGAGTGEVCGTIAGITCAADTDFCQTATDQCGTQDAAGKCVTKPEVCTKEYEPVCGCDGKTYGNACEAAAAGMNVAAEGECSAQSEEG